MNRLQSPYGSELEMPLSAAYPSVTGTNFSSTALNFLVTDLALHEELGVWQYALYNFMGWNELKAAS